MRWARFVLFVLYLLGSTAVFADGPSRSQISASEFVQRFYDWYTPVARRSGKSPSWLAALNARGVEFDSRLRHALRADAEAQRRSPDDIVGLDFDPFLNSQDPSDQYRVGDVTETAGTYLVSVHGVRGGQKAEQPNVVVEVKASRGSFIFKNFRYGADGNLSDILKLLQDQRTRPPQ